MKLNLHVARILGAIAEQKTSDIGVPMTIAVSDAAGGLIYFAHMDDALPASLDIAITKAYTAAAFRMPTEKLGSLAQPGQPLYGIMESQKTPVALFGGGLPLRVNENVVGAIGISGGTVDEDVEVAECAVSAFEDMSRWARMLREVIGSQGMPADIFHQLARCLPRILEQIDKNLSGYDLSVLEGGVHMMSCDFKRTIEKRVYLSHGGV